MKLLCNFFYISTPNIKGILPTFSLPGMGTAKAITQQVAGKSIVTDNPRKGPYFSVTVDHESCDSGT